MVSWDNRCVCTAQGSATFHAAGRFFFSTHKQGHARDAHLKGQNVRGDIPQPQRSIQAGRQETLARSFPSRCKTTTTTISVVHPAWQHDVDHGGHVFCVTRQSQQLAAVEIAGSRRGGRKEE